MTVSIPLATVANWLHNALGEIVNVLTHLSVLDWIVVGVALFVAWWGWARALSFARLGSIVIKDIEADDDSLDPKAAKAVLQEQFAKRGLVPPSGVPSGSPSVASIAAALSAAPIPQANWLGTLVGLLPLPPTATGFEVTGTLRTSGDPSKKHGKKYGITYQLVCTGPRKSVKFDDAWGPDWLTTFDAASKAIYRKIGEAAPDIYPRWARWSSSKALTAYREGLEIERPSDREDEELRRQSATDRYGSAPFHYREASRLDPDNMLVRLRLANCLERVAADASDDKDRVGKQFDALLEYMAIRARSPTIFEAGFRASLLLSGLGEQAEEILLNHLHELDTLRTLLKRTMLRDRETAGWLRRISERFHSAPKAAGKPTEDFRLTAAQREVLQPPADGAAPEDPAAKRARLKRIGDEKFGTLYKKLSGLERMLDYAAGCESRLARCRLFLWWLVVNEGRFRHRFEPTGQERRQLKKALGISRTAIRARRASRRSREKVGVRAMGQPWWIAWVYWRYMFARGPIAGWQAHYNAACFYALLPLAREPAAGKRWSWIAGELSSHLRGRALAHLTHAIDDAPNGALSFVYVRDEDRDLEVLRRCDNDEFQRIVRRLSQDEFTLHYRRPAGDGGSLPEVRVEGVDQTIQSPPLKPTSETNSEAVYQIKILDETKPVTVVAAKGDGNQARDWTLIPAALDTSQVWVGPGEKDVEKRAPAIPHP